MRLLPILHQLELEHSFAGVSITRSEGGFYQRRLEGFEFVGVARRPRLAGAILAVIAGPLAFFLAAAAWGD
jgi:hypothetical protein